MGDFVLDEEVVEPHCCSLRDSFGVKRKPEIRDDVDEISRVTDVRFHVTLAALGPLRDTSSHMIIILA